jgi:deoxyribodipyrimidine photo-lyase
MNFPTDYNKILERLEQLNVYRYAASRNYIDGQVSYLSPYISRGVFSTNQVFKSLLTKGYNPRKIEKFIQELAWRDYWQQVWIHKGDAINKDLKNEQEKVAHHKMPKAIINAETSIEAVDTSIEELYNTGYMHNHVRMYTAAIACNIGQSHWLTPAKWMYYHLLDSDWASNALSWQWVAGANANKKYFANQENINKYCHTEQKDTFLDVPYSAFDKIDIPDKLKETDSLNLQTNLPETDPDFQIDESKPIYIYNWYNLDPEWDKDIDANRVLLLEPGIFKQYPISKKSIAFMLGLAKNISGIQIYTGSFESLIKKYPNTDFHYKEHPLNNYTGVEHPRDWMFSVKGYFPSFFSFWKKCKKELK